MEEADPDPGLEQSRRSPRRAATSGSSFLSYETLTASNGRTSAMSFLDLESVRSDANTPRELHAPRLPGGVGGVVALPLQELQEPRIDRPLTGSSRCSPPVALAASPATQTPSTVQQGTTAQTSRRRRPSVVTSCSEGASVLESPEFLPPLSGPSLPGVPSSPPCSPKHTPRGISQGTRRRRESLASSQASSDYFLTARDAVDLHQAFAMLDDFLSSDTTYMQDTFVSTRSEGQFGSVDSLRPRSWSQRLTRSRWFIAFFVLLTFYALFAPDLDQVSGNKDSQQVMGILSTVVFFLFLLEVVLHSFAKRAYVLRAHFWLDMVAALSLLPDTYLMQSILFDSNSFAVGRSSRFLKTIRIASRSARAMRLNRLARVVRVAALVPRLTNLMGHSIKGKGIDRVLDKHLRMIFQCIDKDVNGVIPRVAAIQVLARIMAQKGAQGDKKDLVWAAKVARKLPRALTRTGFGSRSREESTEVTSPRASNADDEVVDLDEFKDILLREEWCKNRLRRVCSEELRNSDKISQKTLGESENMGVKVALGVLALLLVLSMAEREGSDLSLERGLLSIDTLVRFQFPNVSAGAQIPTLVQAQVKAWVHPFTGDPDNLMTRRLRYLDLRHQIFCNELVATGSSCSQSAGDVASWGLRTSLHQIDHDLGVSSLRSKDVIAVRIAPNVNDDNEQSMSDEEFNRETSSFAVVDGSDELRKEAGFSIITTLVALVSIFGGIIALTKDLRFLSANLLAPLQDLADELESIVYLQLTGYGADKAMLELDATSTAAEKDLGVVSEVRVIRRTFENMKMAIKSWGKYVPWPVVQMMLHTSVEASLQVREEEVTVFFSDIASFTTIVESLPPERSLLLLSRYFNDMSRIIDDHGGIVIEFIGDAILGVYGAPMVNPNHPKEAVNAALVMIAALAKMNAWFAARELPNISVRFGIHTGTVVVGNMGFQSRMKYGIVGEDGHLPSKLEELNKTYSTKVLISRAVFERIMQDPSHEDDFITRPVDYIRLRPHASSEPELIFEVLEHETKRSRSNALRTAMAHHALGMSSYRSRDFEKAASFFEHVNTMMRDLTSNEDVPSDIMARRCRALVDSPPPQDWDGVWSGPI